MLIQDFIDTDYAIDLDQRRSTTGYVFTVADEIQLEGVNRYMANLMINDAKLKLNCNTIV